MFILYDVYKEGADNFMEKNLNVKDMVITALLIAFGIIIPTAFSGLRVILPPAFTATLTAHVPIFVAMFISPIIIFNTSNIFLQNT